MKGLIMGNKYQKQFKYFCKLMFVTIVFALLNNNLYAYNWAWDQGHETANIISSSDERPYSSSATCPDDETQCNPQTEGETCDCEGACCIGESTSSQEEEEEEEEKDECQETNCNVWSINGGYFEQKTDLEVPGKGPKLSVTRIWNSIDKVNSIVGNNWTLNVGRNVIPVIAKDGDEYLVYRNNKGFESKFKRNGDNYYSTSGNFDPGFIITRTDSGFNFTYHEGKIHQYNDHGKIERIIDRHGLYIQFMYDVNGCIMRATNASGNYIDFMRNPNGKIESIADNFGRSVTYVYDVNGNLAQVDYQNGASVKYGYDDWNSMTSVTNMRGDTIRRAGYDNKNRVVQYWENGEEFRFEYGHRTTTKMDSHGRRWTKSTDGFGVAYRTKDANGNYKRKVVINSRIGSEVDENGNTTYYTYDDMGNKTSKTDAFGSQEFWTYNANNKILSYTNEIGAITRYEYDANGNNNRIIEAADSPEERYILQGFDQNNLINSISRYGKTTVFQYDTLGNTRLIVGPANDSTIMTYDSLGRLVDKNIVGKARSGFEYDLMGNITSIINQYGGVTKNYYDFDNNLIGVVTPLGDSTTYEYNAWGHLIYEINGGDTISYQYEIIGDDPFVKAKRDKAGRWVYSEYDDLGRVIKTIQKNSDTLNVADSNDYVTSYIYDAKGNLTQTVYSDGSHTDITYDALSREIVRIRGTDTTWIEYTPDGRVALRKQNAWSILNYEYSLLGNIKLIYDLLDTIEENEYNVNGDLVKKIAYNMDTTYFSYYENGNLKKTIHPDSSFTELAYLSNGKLASEIDGNGNSTLYKYDSLGRNDTIINALGYIERKEFDSLGLKVADIDNEGNRTEYLYDSLGRNTKTVFPDGKYEEISYDMIGRLVSITKMNGVVVSYTYDDLDRYSKVEYSSGKVIDYEYYLSGQLKQISTDVTMVYYEYYDDGKLKLTRQTVGGASYDVNYSYNINTRIMAVTYPNGKVIEKKYNERGNLDSLDMDGVNILNQVYSGDDLVQKNLGNGISANFNYLNGNLVTISHSGGVGVLPGYEIGYDDAKNVKSIKATHFQENSVTLSYDNTHQLTRYNKGTMNAQDSIETPLKYQSWNFDSRGNWSSLDDNGSAQNRTHNGVNEIVTLDGASLTYNQNGDVLSDGQNSYTWDNDHHLINGNGVSYVYDAFGRRVQKVSATATTTYVYDRWQVIMEIVSDGSTKSYTYGNYIDEPIAMVRFDGASENTYFYLQGINYNVDAVTNSQGELVEHYIIDPYGKPEVLVDNGSDNIWFTSDDVIGSGSNIGNEYLFQGRRFSFEYGLYYFRNREYSPQLGRFLNRDPMKYVDGLNLYSFLGNGTYNKLDPYGYFFGSSSLPNLRGQIGLSGSMGYYIPVVGVFGIFIKVKGEVTIGSCCMDGQNKNYRSDKVSISGGVYAGAPGASASLSLAPAVKKMDKCPESSSINSGSIVVAASLGPLGGECSNSGNGWSCSGSWAFSVNGGDGDKGGLVPRVTLGGSISIEEVTVF